MQVRLLSRQLTTHRTRHNASVPMPSAVSVRMRIWADEQDIVIPVPSATYAARHIGHFGISPSNAPGTIHPKASLTRRRPVR